MTDKSYRKTSTIIAMDVVNYSVKMGANEDATLRELKACRQIITKIVKEHSGRVFNTAGDAFMIEFNNSLSAVNASIEIQSAISIHNQKIKSNESLVFRVGINMGDVMMDGENLLGDGVNVASRLEGIAPPGGICISETVFSVVRSKLKIGVIDKGAQKLKNINNLVKCFYLDLDTGVVDPKKFNVPNKYKAKSYFATLASISIILISIIFYFLKFKEDERMDFNKIVVLPIKTENKDESTKNLSLGLTQDLISGLTSTSKSLNILSLSKSPDDLRILYHENKVKYILTGILRRSEDSLRISLNLLDAEDLSTVWSEKYDKKFNVKNIFYLQDEIVGDVIDTLVGNGAVLSREVAKNVSKKGTNNLSAYECVNFVRGQFFKVLSTDLHIKSVECLEKSVKDDPEYKEAWQLLAQLYTWGYTLYGRFPKQILQQAEVAVDNALRIDKDYARAYASKAELLFASGRSDESYINSEKAVKLAPGDAATVGIISYLVGLMGYGCNSPEKMITKYQLDRKLICKRADRGYELAKQAYQLDEGNIYSYDNYGLGNYFLEKREWKKVIEVFEKIPNPGFVWWLHAMGVAYHGNNDFEKAQEMFDKLNDIAGPNSVDRILNEYSLWGHARIFIDELKPIYKQYSLK